MPTSTLPPSTALTVVELGEQITKYEPFRDAIRRYLTDRPTPERFGNYWKQIDSGDLAAMVEMSEEMEAKNARIYALASRRRQSITELDWDIEPPPEDEVRGNAKSAEQVADFVRSSLRALRSFPCSLEHLATGITSGISVVELVWSKGLLADTIDVPGDRLNMVPWEDADVRIMHDNDWIGTPATPVKFVVFSPTQRSWNRTRVVLPRAASYLFLAEHYAISDWLAFCELCGMPWRIAKAPDAGSDEVKKQLEKAFKRMTADGYLVLPTGVEVELLEASRAAQPFGDLMAMVHDEMSILYLGQTMTTDVADRGALATAKVHKEVAASINASDRRQLDRVLREQLVRPMVEMKYPRQDVPVPYLKFETKDEVNVEAARLEIDRMKAAREFGVRLDDDWMMKALEVQGEVVEPKPQVSEDEPAPPE